MKTKILTLLLLLSVTFTMTAKESQNKSFEEVIKPYVVKLIETADKGIDLAQQEIPVVIEQYLMFESVQTGSIVLASIMLMLLPLYTKNLWWIEEKDMTFDSDDYIEKNGKYKHFALYNILPIFSTGLGITMFLFTIMDFIKVTFFPKLYLVEQFINVLK